MWKWAGIVALTLGVVAIEARYRWEDWRGMRQYVSAPIVLAPGAAVAARRSGAEILAVNGRTVRGASDVWREMVAPDRGLEVRVRRTSGREEVVTPVRSHCTCGRESDGDIFWYAVLPGLALALAGLAAVWLWPEEKRAWAVLGLCLGIGQVDLFPPFLEVFLHGAEPMAWEDWMRAPTVAYRGFLQMAWAGFALAAAGVGRAWPWVVLGVLKAAMLVGWSEHAAATAGLWRFWGAYETELVLGALALSAARTGWWWVAVGAATAAGFYYAVPFDGIYKWVAYSDKTERVAISMAGLYQRPELLIAAGVFGLIAAGGRRGWMVGAACLPVLYVTVAHEFWIWHWDYVLGSIVVLSYPGVAWLVRDARPGTLPGRGR